LQLFRYDYGLKVLLEIPTIPEHNITMNLKTGSSIGSLKKVDGKSFTGKNGRPQQKKLEFVRF
jgi:hypothetical protein